MDSDRVLLKTEARTDIFRESINTCQEAKLTVHIVGNKYASVLFHMSEV